VNCFDKETAAAYLSGDLDLGAADICALHVGVCKDCQIIIEEVSALIDGVREDLLLIDVQLPGESLPPMNPAGSEIGSVEVKFSETARGGLPHRVGRLDRWFSSARPIWPRLAFALVLLAAAPAVVFLLSTRERVSAGEILRRAEASNANARTQPDRVIFRLWKETVANGLGPLPDGEYRCETWWDNRHNVSVTKRSDAQRKLRQANWLLEDGRTFAFVNWSGSTPEVYVGPTDGQVSQEIEGLPAEIREKVRNYFQFSRRPLRGSASDLMSQQEREIVSSLSGQKANAKAQVENAPGGKRGYRVTSFTDITNPESRVRRWESSRLILDQTYSLIEERMNGYRTDGLIYAKSRWLLDEQVFVAGEQALPVFSPGTFPSETIFHTVPVKDRVEFLKKQAIETKAVR
jgi:hypothetical protein